ncbi:MAG: hypothetical protein CYPHOPRED_001227 [Cyphobasidiales sp. Tagirdzhanova-0007]|nr:MAG: hypothetical protein CYPHOPRED_001227 [Cyphobasidiales sp. Tagirdzhanova-0007]
MSKLFITLLCATLALQTVVALPARGSYGQLARRATASKVARRSGPSSVPAAQKKRAASIASYLSQLTRRRDEDAHIVAALSSAIPTFAPVNAAFVRNPKFDIAASSTTLGGEFAQWASAAGVRTAFASATSTPTSFSAPFVSAANVTLPTAAAAKRDLNKVENPKQHLINKRVVAHPGEPSSATVQIDVIGGSTMQGFTLLNATNAPTSTDSYVAATSTAAVNVIFNISSADALPTVTKTLVFTISPSAAVETATVTLVPTLLPGKTNASYVPLDNSTIEAESRQEKRNNIAFFQVPALAETTSKIEMMSEDWEDCIIGVDAGCLEVPEQSATIEKRYTSEEMMSDDWEDCQIGVDADCLEI